MKKVIKPINLIILIFLIIVGFLFMYISFTKRIILIHFILSYWLLIIYFVFVYRKVIVNTDSLTFSSFIRDKIITFNEIRNADIDIWFGIVTIKKYIFLSCIRPKTKDGLIKAIQLSDKVVSKDYYIKKIEYSMNWWILLYGDQ